MEEKSVISEIIQRLIATGRPIKIILFGSKARKSSGPNSDFDILVIESKVENRFKEMIMLRRALRGLLVPIDIIVISLSEYETLSKIPGTVYYHAEQEGSVLYEAA